MMIRGLYILLLRRMTSKQNKNWTQYKEDRALRELKQQRGIEKWTIIAKTLEEEFKIMGKSGKRCRERYFHHLDTNVKKDQWTPEQEVLLERLHNQKGNKWVQIAKELQRSDNDVKNHFHSKLRRAIRKINLLICSNLRSQFKPLKNNIISKILQASQESQQHQSPEFQAVSKLGQSLKSKILSYLAIPEKDIEIDPSSFKVMLKQISLFGKSYKKKGTSKSEPQSQRNCCRYKGKEILNLISENKIKIEERNQIISESNIEESSSEEDQNIQPQNLNQSEGCLAPSQHPHYVAGPSHPFLYPVIINPYYPYPHHLPFFDSRYFSSPWRVNTISHQNNSGFRNYEDISKRQEIQELPKPVKSVETVMELSQSGEPIDRQTFEPRIKHEVNHID